jgi:TolB protein
MNAGRVSDRLVGSGRSLYFGWSPDGRQIVWHAGGNGRYDQDAELALYDLQVDRIQVLSEAPGSFLAPAWSPDGERWTAVWANGDFDELGSFVGSVATGLTGIARREAAFSWSPSGKTIAYALRERSEHPFFAPIQLLDPDTGHSRQITDDGFRIVAFFWSPDGRRLAYLTWLDVSDSTWSQWRVFDLITGQDRGFAMFSPTPLMWFALGSFNQFAQSHRFWSPDGRFLVYADRDPKLLDRVWLVDTRSTSGADPILVAEGSLGYWSWH